jgi:Tol biopolymer transport system component
MQIKANHNFHSKPKALPPARKLTDLSGDPYAPKVTPNGDTVIFAAGTSQPLVREMYSVGIDGSNQTQLTDRQVNLSWHPAISPDGLKIAYVVEKEGHTDLQVMNLDGSGNVNLTDTNKGYWYPSWSADGKTIATTSRDTEHGNLEVVTVAADGTSKTQLTAIGYNTDVPTFSPTASHIVFGLAPGMGASVLCSIHADGSNFKTYSTEMMLIGEPVVTKSGHIIFSASKGDGKFGLYETVLDSEEPAKLLVDTELCMAPTLSPDEGRIAYMDVDGEGDVQLFEASRHGEFGVRQLTEGDSFNSSPAYTPDGNGLVYISMRDGDSELYFQNLRPES